VLIAAAGAIKVVDFGIAQVDSATTRLTRAGDVIGTPAYMPPEQLIGGSVDARTDIFAVGVILTEMLTGQHPLAPGRRAMPIAASEIAWRCIQADPNDRYQSARELLAVLDRELAKFHQAVVSVAYAVMLWPTWLTRSIVGGWDGNAIFVAVLAATIVAVTLRLHLWFTSRLYPFELLWARSRAMR
jgi:serine/threonine protein kinase